MTAPYECPYCGAPCWNDPMDQEAPVDYCHDHGEPNDE